MRRDRSICASALLAAALAGCLAAAPAAGAAQFSHAKLRVGSIGSGSCNGGSLNDAAEPAIHVSRDAGVFLSSEAGPGTGTRLWRGLGLLGGGGAQACKLRYAGQPNAVGEMSDAGADTDMAIASARSGAGNYNVYVASLNAASVTVSTSTDNGQSFSQVPLVMGVPADDREWIAAHGSATSLLSFIDGLNSIEMLRSDNGGGGYSMISRPVPLTDPRGTNSEIGNLVVDRRNHDGTAPGGGMPGFWAYQGYIGQHDPINGSGELDEAFVAVSNNGGYTWTDRPIGCSRVTKGGIDHTFLILSVAPGGRLWASWSNERHVFVANSADHGRTWSCSPKISTTTDRAIFPWIVAGSRGIDLVYYGSPKPRPGRRRTFYVYFAQDPGGGTAGFRRPQRLFAVHRGTVCEQGLTCTANRQLFDDFGVDTDPRGWAHIAYSHDAPKLGGPSSYTGYAVQTAGRRIGHPN